MIVANQNNYKVVKSMGAEIDRTEVQVEAQATKANETSKVGVF